MSFKKLYLDWYDLSSKTLDTEVANPTELRNIKGLALAGMGGSGIVCDVIYSMLYSNSRKPLAVIKGFNLPKWVSRGWLVLTISYSGNTLETLSVAKEAVDREAYLASVTSGGKLLELSKKKSIPYILVEGGRAPRASFPSLLLGGIKILHDLGVLTEGLKSARNSIDVLRDVERAEKISSGLSDFIEGKIPVFVTDNTHYPLALRGKDELNENSKYLAMTQVYPENAHNDIVGWEGWFGPLTAIFVGIKTWVLDYVSSYLTLKGVPIKWFDLSGMEPYLKRVLWWSLVIGLTSLRLAWRRGLNPEKTESIRMYKDSLKKYLSLKH